MSTQKLRRNDVRLMIEKRLPLEAENICEIKNDNENYWWTDSNGIITKKIDSDFTVEWP